jgi:excinuclease ABC subunit B
MYANDITRSMAAAIEETERRREMQIAYNTVRGIDPQPLLKKISDITDQLAREKADTDEMFGPKTDSDDKVAVSHIGAGPEELPILIRQLTDQMMQASHDLKFELAARLRDEIMDLKRALREMIQLGR